MARSNFGRTAQHRRALMRNLCTSLLEHELIVTTTAKAKAAKAYMDNILHYIKRENVEWAKRKVLGRVFLPRELMPKLFDTLATRYAGRAGSCTRLIKLEPRLGDNAPQLVLELVDGTTNEMGFWYTAKIVARLEKQGIEVDAKLRSKIERLNRFRENGDEEFRKAVERCKDEFFTHPALYATTPAERRVRGNKRQGLAFVPRPAKPE